LADVDQGTFVKRDLPVAVADDARILRNPDYAAVAAMDLRNRVDQVPFALQFSDQRVGMFLVDVPLLTAPMWRTEQFGRRLVSEHLRQGEVDVDEATLGKASIDSLRGRVEQGPVAVDGGLFS